MDSIWLVKKIREPVDNSFTVEVRTYVLEAAARAYVKDSLDGDFVASHRDDSSHLPNVWRHVSGRERVELEGPLRFNAQDAAALQTSQAQAVALTRLAADIKRSLALERTVVAMADSWFNQRVRSAQSSWDPPSAIHAAQMIDAVVGPLTGQVGSRSYELAACAWLAERGHVPRVTKFMKEIMDRAWQDAHAEIGGDGRLAEQLDEQRDVQNIVRTVYGLPHLP
jgi:hypothetical protein